MLEKQAGIQDNRFYEIDLIKNECRAAVDREAA